MRFDFYKRERVDGVQTSTFLFSKRFDQYDRMDRFNAINEFAKTEPQLVGLLDPNDGDWKSPNLPPYWTAEGMGY